MHGYTLSTALHVCMHACEGSSKLTTVTYNNNCGFTPLVHIIYSLFLVYLVHVDRVRTEITNTHTHVHCV